MTVPIVNYFEEIYEAAKSKNELALRELIEAGACIDEVSSDSRYGAAVTCLAFENNQAAVEFLLMWGAAIDYAVMGAAQGGHIAFANDLIKRGAAIGMAARGAAKGVQKEYLRDLIEKNSDTLTDFLPLLGAAAESNDMRFIAELVTIIREREPSMPLKRIANSAVYGAAKGGCTYLAEKLIQMMGADINYAVRGAAQHGDVAFVVTLLRRGASVQFAGAGAGIGGHAALVDYLITLGATTTNVGRSAAMGGHVRLVEALVEKDADIDEVIKGAMASSHYTLVNRLQELKILNDNIRWMSIVEHCQRLQETIERETTLRLQELNRWHEVLNLSPVGFSLFLLPMMVPSQAPLLAPPALAITSISSSSPNGSSTWFHPASDSVGQNTVSLLPSSKRVSRTLSHKKLALAGDDADSRRVKRSRR